MEKMCNIQGNNLSFAGTVAASFIGSALAITAAVGVGMVAAKKMKGSFIRNFAAVFVAGNVNAPAGDLDDLWDGEGEDGDSPEDIIGDISGVDAKDDFDVVDFIPED